MTDSFAGDLRQHIYQAHANGPRRGSHWVMNLEWFNEIRKLHDNDGRPVWAPGPAEPIPLQLLGIPVEVREDGGVPRLELDG